MANIFKTVFVSALAAFGVTSGVKLHPKDQADVLLLPRTSHSHSHFYNIHRSSTGVMTAEFNAEFPLPPEALFENSDSRKNKEYSVIIDNQVANTTSPSPTPSPSASPNATVTPTPTPSPSASPNATVTPTPTPSPSASPNATVTPTPTPSPSASPNATVTPSVMPTPSASAAPTQEPSASITPLPSVTATPAPSVTPESKSNTGFAGKAWDFFTSGSVKGTAAAVATVLGLVVTGAGAVYGVRQCFFKPADQSPEGYATLTEPPVIIHEPSDVAREKVIGRKGKGYGDALDHETSGSCCRIS